MIPSSLPGARLRPIVGAAIIRAMLIMTGLAPVAVPCVAWAQPAAKPKPPLDEVQALIRGVETTAEPYRLKLRDGVFDEEADAALRASLTSFLDPRLAAGLERHRERLRVLLYGDAIENEKTWDQAAMRGVELLTRAARTPDLTMPVRVNSLLLAGEIRAKGIDGKSDRYPAEAAPVLAGVAMDAELPPALRVVAVTGLTRQVEAALAAGKKSTPAAVTSLGESIGQTFVSLATAGLEGGQAAEWLASKSLDALRLFVPRLPPGANGAAARIVTDANRSIDLRVRAARLLGMSAAPANDFNAPAVENTIGPLAVAALKADESLAEERRLRQRLGSSPTVAPGSPAPVVDGPLLGSLECDRTCWRLTTLADSLLAEDGKMGLVVASGGDAKAGRALAAKLREAAKKIDASPKEGKEAAIRESLAILAPAAAIPVQEPRPDIPIAPPLPIEESPFAAPAGPPR